MGPLIVPTTAQQFTNKSVPLPPKLFSHNDQQAYWQTLTGAEGATAGWGGRSADLMLSQNSKAALSSVSINGNTVFVSGHQTNGYRLSASGPVTVNALKTNGTLFNSAACAQALSALIRSGSSSGHLMEAEYVSVMNRALDLYDDVNASLVNTPTALTDFFATGNATTNPNTLSQQLHMVARMLHQRDTFGIKRQIFLVGLGGFDLHDFLPTQHPLLLQRVSDALLEFNNALDYLGLANQVTTFTASDFGRTLSSNGDGSDHGWGSHHFILGGAVNGGRFFGKAPPIGVTHSEQVGSGRLLPTTAVEQMGAELGRWFGVSDTDMPAVFPHSVNFNLHQLGLMKA